MIQELAPKARFQKTDAAINHASIASSIAFKEVLTIALAHFSMTQTRPEGLEAACRSTYEMAGAKRFIDVLLNLSEPDPTPPQKPQDNLWTQPPPSQTLSEALPSSKPPRRRQPRQSM